MICNLPSRGGCHGDRDLTATVAAGNQGYPGRVAADNRDLTATVAMGNQGLTAGIATGSQDHLL